MINEHTTTMEVCSAPPATRHDSASEYTLYTYAYTRIYTYIGAQYMLAAHP